MPPDSSSSLSDTLVFNNVAIDLDGHRLITLNARIAPGEVVSVMGPSGVGKSTLLAYAAGFLAPAFRATGHVYLGQRELTGLPAQQRHLGLLFQDPLLFPHLNVGGNLAFGMPASIKRSERRERVESALADIGLAGFAKRDPATLSGGQKARVALMRVLLSQPHAMLLDEPFSKLDAALRHDMRQMVFERIRARGLPALMVTHDHADAEATGDAVIELLPTKESEHDGTRSSPFNAHSSTPGLRHAKR